MANGNSPDYSKYIIPLSVVIGGGLLVYGIGKKIGLFKSDEQIEQERQEQERKDLESGSIVDICTRTPTTKTEAEWKQIADVLEHDLDYAGYLTSYGNDAVYQLARAKNLCDVMNLIRFFGERALRSPLLVKSGNYTLVQAVKERLETEQVATVNDNYRRKNIPYQF